MVFYCRWVSHFVGAGKMTDNCRWNGSFLFVDRVIDLIFSFFNLNIVCVYEINVYLSPAKVANNALLAVKKNHFTEIVSYIRILMMGLVIPEA